jgi:hypothetical protein
MVKVDIKNSMRQIFENGWVPVYSQSKPQTWNPCLNIKLKVTKIRFDKKLRNWF